MFFSRKRFSCVKLPAKNDIRKKKRNPYYFDLSVSITILSDPTNSNDYLICRCKFIKRKIVGRSEKETARKEKTIKHLCHRYGGAPLPYSPPPPPPSLTPLLFLSLLHKFSRLIETIHLPETRPGSNLDANDAFRRRAFTRIEFKFGNSGSHDLSLARSPAIVPMLAFFPRQNPRLQ